MSKVDISILTDREITVKTKNSIYKIELFDNYNTIQGGQYFKEKSPIKSISGYNGLYTEENVIIIGESLLIVDLHDHVTITSKVLDLE